ncbi:MAG TPA: hypothetical protein VH854_07510 [Thermoanaerobaculia bacterium]|nr:hypothetical protein [Thermoanaerobaculia bacterium]
MIPLRAPAEISSRLGVAAARQILLVECPEELAAIVRAAAAPEAEVSEVEARYMRSAKDPADLILVFQESRVGSHAVLDAAVKRLQPGGHLWVVTAMRKVQGPKTAAAHRLESADLDKAFEKTNLLRAGEAKVGGWHVAYGFRKREP